MILDIFRKVQVGTVYPDKTSGNWYWVSYNGVSGYSYKDFKYYITIINVLRVKAAATINSGFCC